MWTLNDKGWLWSVPCSCVVGMSPFYSFLQLPIFESSTFLLNFVFYVSQILLAQMCLPQVLKVCSGLFFFFFSLQLVALLSEDPFHLIFFISKDDPHELQGAVSYAFHYLTIYCFEFCLFLINNASCGSLMWQVKQAELSTTEWNQARESLPKSKRVVQRA